MTDWTVRRGVLLVLAAGLALGACSSDGSGGGAATQAPAPVAGAETDPAAAAKSADFAGRAPGSYSVVGGKAEPVPAIAMGVGAHPPFADEAELVAVGPFSQVYGAARELLFAKQGSYLG